MTHRLLRPGAVAVLIAAAGAATSSMAIAQDGRPYYYRKVAEGGAGLGNGLTFLSPLLNNNGTVAFYATKAGVGNAILTGPSFEANAYVSDATGVGPYRTFGSGFALNDAGSIALAGRTRATDEFGVFVGHDAAHNLISGWGVIGASPTTLTNNGKVAISGTYGLYTYNPSRNHDIYLLGQAGASGSARVAENTFNGPDGTFRRLDGGPYVINEAAQSAFMAQAWDQLPNGRVEGIYRENTTATPYLDSRGTMFDVDGWLDLNNAGTLAFTASTDDDLFTDALFVGTGENAQRIAEVGEDYSAISWVDINDNGTVAFSARVTGTPGNGVFTGPSQADDRVAGPGDVLFGKTVRDAYFRRGGLNNKGEIAFEVTSTDLVDMIVVATPATLGDANLDGQINFDDYVALDNGFNNGLTGWANGDFNSDGEINFDDYVLIDASFNAQGGGGRLSSVPEPSAALAAGAMALATIGRRCRSRGRRTSSNS